MPPPVIDVPPSAPVAHVAPARETRGALAVGLGFAGGASEWSGDGVGYSGITVGLRLWGVVTPYVGGSLGYGRVDQRLLTRLTVGLDAGYTFAGRYRPRAFAAFEHQHEESLASVAEQPAGAVVGIGTGIRHRAGGHFGAGFDWLFVRGQRLQLWVGPELSASYLTYSSGPSWYLTGGVRVSGTLRLW